MFSDAGFKKEEIDGYALRGAVYIRHADNAVNYDGTPSGKGIRGHVLLAESRSIKTVCRSTYAAELMSAASATDAVIPISVTMHEVQYGPLGAEQLRNIRDKGWSTMPYVLTTLMLDAKSVFESCKSNNFKPPAESSLAGHILWIREMHDKGLLHDLGWADTRDMFADGLTKGNVPRDGLQEIMSGSTTLLNYVRNDVKLCIRILICIMHMMYMRAHDVTNLLTTFSLTVKLLRSTIYVFTSAVQTVV